MKSTNKPALTTTHIPPWGSKTRVNKAGDAARNEKITEEDEKIIEQWRIAHRAVINTFQALLRKRISKNKMPVVVAVRHKRKNTIFDKLRRIPTMELSRMDDIAGCRLIFESIEDLNSFRKEMHSNNRFNHRLKNKTDRYDYIKSPKPTGYRGIHDIYEYQAKSTQGQELRGLYVEIQYRTLIQHAWATAVEVVGKTTESQPKFGRGNPKHHTAMSLASEILSRAHENLYGPHPDKTNDELLREFEAIDKEIHLMKTLRRLNIARKEISGKKNFILIFSEKIGLEIEPFEHTPEALKRLFLLEKDMPDRDIVLVRANDSHDIKTAFRNYFSDAKDFISLMDEARSILANKTKTKNSAKI